MEDIVLRPKYECAGVRARRRNHPFGFSRFFLSKKEKITRRENKMATHITGSRTISLTWIAAVLAVTVRGQSSGSSQIRVNLAKGTEVVEAVLDALRDSCLYRWRFGWQDGFIDWLIDWLMNWLIKWVMGGIVYWLIHWWMVRLIDWLIDILVRLMDWLIGWWMVRLNDWHIVIG